MRLTSEPKPTHSRGVCLIRGENAYHGAAANRKRTGREGCDDKAPRRHTSSSQQPGLRLVPTVGKPFHRVWHCQTFAIPPPPLPPTPPPLLLDDTGLVFLSPFALPPLPRRSEDP